MRAKKKKPECGLSKKKKTTCMHFRLMSSACVCACIFNTKNKQKNQSNKYINCIGNKKNGGDCGTRPRPVCSADLTLLHVRSVARTSSSRHRRYQFLYDPKYHTPVKKFAHAIVRFFHIFKITNFCTEIITYSNVFR